MLTRGLSTDQAPPFLSIARFFITAPLFGLAAALFGGYFGFETMQNRFDPTVIGIVHLITIGFFAQIILGATAQMLPVLAGIKLPKVHITAAVVHALSVVGTICLVYGFLFASRTALFAAAAAMTLCFALFFLPLIGQFLKGNFKNTTINAMRLAALFGLITALLGSHLATSHATTLKASSMALANTHIAVAFFGFAGLLIIGVAHQVVPMFYVAPKFPKFCKTWIATTAVSLFLFAISSLQEITWLLWSSKLLIITGFLAFATVAARTLQKRKRKLLDSSIVYWYVSISFLGSGILLWALFGIFEVKNADFILAVWLGGGFLMSLMNGMLMKIVPFVVWLHLSSVFVPALPNIRDILPENLARTQLSAHVAAVFCLLLSQLYTPLFTLGCLIFAVSNLLLFAIVIRAVRVYLRLLPTGFVLEKPKV